VNALAAVKLWLAIRPVKRIKQAIWLRKLRRASKSGEIIDLQWLKKESDVNAEQAMGLVRHVLTFGGGFAVARGWLSAEELTALVGAGVAIAGVVWSIRQKRKAA